jgi:glycosyltransferase involved in cell wall biosynthesis
MSNKTFAIVIPSLNQSHFLSSALESLRYQSASFNLAIMDGGSTDNFRNVVERYSDIITFLHSGPDNGQAGAIKEGKEKVTGDIVAWLNADDYYFPGALDKVANCFEMHPDIDVVYGDAVQVTEEGFFLAYFPFIQSFNAKNLTRNCFICQPACFVHRSAYERAGGINQSLHYTMDWDLWCRISLNGAKFKYLPELLAAVRCYPGTKTLSRKKERYKEIYRIEKKYGKRFVPISCLCFYHYDLAFEKKKTVFDHICFKLLDTLRKIKKKFFRKKIFNSLLYGFHRFEPTVEGCCTIHIPWYEPRAWRQLRLKVEPEKEYRVSVNGSYCNDSHFEKGCLVVNAPKVNSPCRTISVECVQKKQWKLLGFDVV